MKLIIGLGNIGAKYEGTRHNLGFNSVDAFALEEEATWKEDIKRKAFVAKVVVDDKQVLLAKPTTFMNRSGEAVQALASFYKIEPKDLLVVHDDMDLEPGRIQFKDGGSPAGHNGVENIYERLGSTNIQRLRIGIGQPQGRMAAEDWVLGKLSTEMTPNAIDIIAGMRDWIEYGVNEAANRWN
jgi:PTH1 family peptidyl-tRNA hydrolase